MGGCGLVDRDVEEFVGAVEEGEELWEGDEVVLAAGDLALFVHVLQGELSAVVLKDVCGLRLDMGVTNYGKSTSPEPSVSSLNRLFST
jgi:hypothetical protein